MIALISPDTISRCSLRREKAIIDLMPGILLRGSSLEYWYSKEQWHGLYVDKIHFAVLDDYIDTTTDTNQRIFNVFDALLGFIETVNDKIMLIKPHEP